MQRVTCIFYKPLKKKFYMKRTLSIQQNEEILKSNKMHRT